MNTWNSERVRAGFPSHAKGFITDIDGQVELQHPMIAGVYRAAVSQETATSQDSVQLFQSAREF